MNNRSKRMFHPDMERALHRADQPKLHPELPASTRHGHANTPAAKGKELQLFSEDAGPQLYHPPNHLVTKPLITKNLPKVFDKFPIYGKPDANMSLNRFYKNKVKAFVGEISEKQFREIAKMCSTDHLTCGKEICMKTDIQDPILMNVHLEPQTLPNDEELHKLRIVAAHQEKLASDQEERYLKRALKYRSVHVMPLNQQARNLNDHKPAQVETNNDAMKKGKKGKGKKGVKGCKTKAEVESYPDEGIDAVPYPLCDIEDQLEPGRDILIKIRIYKPFDYTDYKTARPSPDRALYNMFYHDLVLTGRNLVSDIKDRFVCSEKPLKEKANNGFLFIKNTFYVDKLETSAEHAESLQEWCSLRNFGNFPRRDMRACRLDALEIKLGNPDVYIHDSTCEHIMIFSEVRLLHASDPLRQSYYPCVTSIAQNNKMPFCYNCAELYPKWIVSGCVRIPFNMALFCQFCLRNVLYDSEGVKICKFKAYPYKGVEACKAH